MSNGFHKGTDLSSASKNTVSSPIPRKNPRTISREDKSASENGIRKIKTKTAPPRSKRRRKKQSRLRVLLAFVVVIVGVTGFFLWRSIAFTKDKAAELIKQEACATLGCDQEGISPLMEAIASEMRVQVKTLEKTQDGYTAICSVGNHNFQKATEQMDADSQNEQSLSDYVSSFADVYRKQPYLTQEMTLELKKTDDTYSLSLTEEQADAFTGGVLSYYAETYENS